tara:strand:- start:699 stop:1157 length:459 start_codon:yes stop_codon:yes gene_type:complete
MGIKVGSGHLKGDSIEELMKLIGPNFALINPKSVCGQIHLSQAATLADKAHLGEYNFSKDRSTELLLYLTGQRQISKAIEIAGLSSDSKEAAWASFSEVPKELSSLLEADVSLISKANFDYSSHGINDESLDLDKKQKIIMTRTASLPVQSR